MELIKPKHLSVGDTITTVSISHGWAGEKNILWKYKLGKKRLEEIYGLKVIPAPNSMKGSEYLKNNPKIFIGYSDVINIHLLCYKIGLTTFYGHNFLLTIAEAQLFHKYNRSRT